MTSLALEKLINEFNKLPGIGKKSATRIAFHLINSSMEEIKTLTSVITEAKAHIRHCSICSNLTEQDICNICSDLSRRTDILCIVEDCRDIISLEKTATFRGKYHVLNGKIAPLKGITPDKLNIESLLIRIASEPITEVIIAINPDLEGETTTLYLNKLIKNFNIKVTRIASGLPMGGNLEYADTATISQSLNGRHEIY